MENIKNIVVSTTEPSKKDLWLKDDGLYFFGTKGWELVGSTQYVVTSDVDYVSANTYTYQQYLNNGGTKSEEEFYIALTNLIDA